ncbi:DNA mismatch repair protein MutS [uncultured Thermanaerothrix sp.]|uniref:DNA mismatch repair protein MutS n=1 Tax=uncultured Thermanaerothrix sp. TaxID=1195149 RepID=UPI002627212E|nr:DNA mismatch repair protein MutS [uncultured Thermanaerothrix sp.]
MTQDDVSPIRQQYLEIKRQYPHAILFFRLGDFYETFDEDAEITARELDIVLTSRNVAKGVRVPMAGIPYHAVENYLSRLIEKGYHVAICEQVGEQPTRGLFPREVVRVVTPGTVVEPALLKTDYNNYLAALIVQENAAGIAYVDITTGEFRATELNGGNLETLLRAELTRIQPTETLLPENQTALGELIPNHTTTLPAWRFEPARCQEILKDHFGVALLDGYGLTKKPLAIGAAGAILQYLQETQPNALRLLTSLATYTASDFMLLDANTRRSLELTETMRQGESQGSLLSVLDYTVTPMGRRLLRQWLSKPLINPEAIRQRQDIIEYFFIRGILRADLRVRLRGLGDLERLTNRVIAGHAGPRDLASLRNILRALPAVQGLFEEGTESPLQAVLARFHLETDLREALETALVEDPPATLQTTGVIRAGYSVELDDLIQTTQHARDWIANLEATERERTGIKTLKVGYNKVFGYYIEISRALASQAPPEYIRKQTLVNAERFITPEMKEYEALILNAEDRIRELESQLFKELCQKVIAKSRDLLETAQALAELDVYAALAEAAALNGYTRPEITEDLTLDIREGRHPVVEKMLKGERFVPNDAVFEEGEIIRIITGPNMSGKSTFLRQVALIVLMAQIGAFVPAASARIGWVDRIFTRIGAQDEIFAGQSTFMVEMTETANILNHATQRSLLILDEIGRGTSTYDGLSIAWAVVEYLHNHPRLRPRTLFATHYHELTQLADLLPGVRNYNVAVTEAENRVVFLHKIVPGGADRSYGIHVAQLAGLPRPVIQRASEILEQLERTSGRAITLKPALPQQLALFPETNPLLEELKALDLNVLTPLEALNKLYEWQRKYLDSK